LTIYALAIGGSVAITLKSMQMAKLAKHVPAQAGTASPA
jgi:hypothetical protein